VGTDHHWVAVYEVVRDALLEDVQLHLDPPSNAEEVGHVAETVADHLVGQFIFERRSQK
jgi:hypothetical protein